MHRPRTPDDGALRHYVDFGRPFATQLEMERTAAVSTVAADQAVEDRRLGQLLAQLRVPDGGFSRPAAAPAAGQSAEQQRKITAVLVGAGNRGNTYTTFALEHPELIQIVGVCDPNRTRRERIASLHSIPSSNVFASWEDLLATHSEKRLSDAVIICTQDQDHRDPACSFAGQVRITWISHAFGTKTSADHACGHFRGTTFCSRSRWRQRRTTASKFTRRACAQMSCLRSAMSYVRSETPATAPCF